MYNDILSYFVLITNAASLTKVLAYPDHEAHVAHDVHALHAPRAHVTQVTGAYQAKFTFSCYSSVTDITIKGLKAVDALVQQIMGTDVANVHTELGKDNHSLSVRDSHNKSSWVWHFLDIQ